MTIIHVQVSGQVRQDHDRVRELVQIAHDIVQPGARIQVNVKKRQGRKWIGGRAYDGVPPLSTNVDPSVQSLVTLRIPTPYAMTYPRLGVHYYRDEAEPRSPRWPVYDLRSWEEELLHLAAHEFQHVFQFATDSPISEIEAERMGADAVDHFRIHPAFEGVR